MKVYQIYDKERKDNYPYYYKVFLSKEEAERNLKQNQTIRVIEVETMTCGDCNRYGDLHSSCFRARYFEANEDDAACNNFVKSIKYKGE